MWSFLVVPALAAEPTAQEIGQALVELAPAFVHGERQWGELPKLVVSDLALETATLLADGAVTKAQLDAAREDLPALYWKPTDTVYVFPGAVPTEAAGLPVPTDDRSRSEILVCALHHALGHAFVARHRPATSVGPVADAIEEAIVDHEPCPHGVGAHVVGALDGSWSEVPPGTAPEPGTPAFEHVLGARAWRVTVLGGGDVWALLAAPPDVPEFVRRTGARPTLKDLGVDRVAPVLCRGWGEIRDLRPVAGGLVLRPSTVEAWDGMAANMVAFRCGEAHVTLVDNWPGASDFPPEGATFVDEGLFRLDQADGTTWWSTDGSWIRLEAPGHAGRVQKALREVRPFRPQP